MPDGIPKVAELGITSAPLKSAAFFLGPFCKEYTGAPPPPPSLSSKRKVGWLTGLDGVWGGGTEDFMLCKAENGDPAHCLLEGRRVTRCATDLSVSIPSLFFPPQPHHSI